MIEENVTYSNYKQGSASTKYIILYVINFLFVYKSM